MKTSFVSGNGFKCIDWQAQQPMATSVLLPFRLAGVVSHNGNLCDQHLVGGVCFQIKTEHCLIAISKRSLVTNSRQKGF